MNSVQSHQSGEIWFSERQPRNINYFSRSEALHAGCKVCICGSLKISMPTSYPNLEFLKKISQGPEPLIWNLASSSVVED